MLDRSRTPASRWWWTLAGATAVLRAADARGAAHPADAPAAPVAPVRSRESAAPAASCRRRHGAAGTAPPAARPMRHCRDAVDAGRTAARRHRRHRPCSGTRQAPPLPPPCRLPRARQPRASRRPRRPRRQPRPRTTRTTRTRRARRNDLPFVLLEPGDHNADVRWLAASGLRPSVSAGQPTTRCSGSSSRAPPYVTYDPAVIQALRDAFVPVNAVGERDGPDGRQDGRAGQRAGRDRRAPGGTRRASRANWARRWRKIAAEHAARVAEDDGRAAARPRAATAADQALRTPSASSCAPRVTPSAGRA